MNRSTLLTLFQGQTGNKDPEVVALFYTWLDEVINTVATSFQQERKLNKTHQFSLAINGESFDVTTAVPEALKVDKIRIISPVDYSGVLTKKTSHYIRSIFGESSDDGQGTPRYWYWDEDTADTIRFYPKADQAYIMKLDYIKTPDSLSDNNSVPFFEKAFHQMLIWGVLAWYYNSAWEQDSVVAEYNSAKFEKELDKYIEYKAFSSNDPSERKFSFSTGVNED
jgi:hypothetical protein